MAGHDLERSFRKRDGVPFVVFLILSLVIKITVQSGSVVDAEASSGPPMLASAAARFVRANWKFSPTTTGTYTLPVSFVLAH